MALDAGLDPAVGKRPCDAQEDVAGLALATVQGGGAGLADAALEQPCRAGNAAAVAAGDGKGDPGRLGGVQDRFILGDEERPPATIGERDPVSPQSQMSEVTSPPG